MTASADRIVKTARLSAPQSRVWRALTDSREFGEWFKIRFDGALVASTDMTGRITHPGYEHLTVTFFSLAFDPERRFSYRWHPHAIDPTHDYSAEPTTLVEFLLESAGSETTLTVIESGFEDIPLRRRLDAFKGNNDGWTAQVAAIQKYLAKPSASSRR